MATLTTASVAESDARVPRTGETPRFSHTVVLTASQMAKWSLRLGFVALVARAMGPERFGTYALIFAMIEFLAIASGATYIDYLTRETAKDERFGWGLASQLFVLRVAIAIPVAAIEIGILALMRYPHAVLAGTAWMALTMIPRSLTESVQGVLRGVHRYGSFLVVEVALGGSLVVGGVFLFLRHGGLRAAIAAELSAASLAGLAGLALALKFRTTERIRLSGWELVKRSAVFNAFSFVATLYDRFDVVLLSRLAGDYATGIYAVAYRALAMTQLLAYGVLFSLLPSLSCKARGSVEQLRLERAMGLLLSAAFGLVLATFTFAGPAVRLLLGEQYAESSIVLKVLIWAVVIRYINYALNIELLAAGREQVFVTTSLVCLAINLIGNLVFIPRFSWRAAAALTIITELVLLGQNVYWVWRTTGRVTLPRGIAGMSFVFAALLIFVGAASHFGSPMVAGTLCLLVFAAYLLLSGMLAEFASTWAVGRIAAE